MTKNQKIREAKLREESYRLGVQAGTSQGERLAKDKFQLELRTKQIESNVRMADAMARLTENVARMTITFYGEGGLHQ